jgi:hypothetical protein
LSRQEYLLLENGALDIQKGDEHNKLFSLRTGHNPTHELAEEEE